MYFDELFIEFAIYSVFGWLFESWYAVMKSGHWENRGFLFGPVCPIYGCGGIIVTLLYDHHLLRRFDSLWKLFLVFVIISAILEYTTSYMMEKIFHARWWDYSEMPLNIHGRICLPASMAFGVIGIFLIQTVIPQVQRLRIMHAVVKHTIAIILCVIISADIALSSASMGQLLENLKKSDAEFAKNMDDKVQFIKKIPHTTKTTLIQAKIKIGETQKNIKIPYRPHIGERYHLRNVIFVKKDTKEK